MVSQSQFPWCRVGGRSLDMATTAAWVSPELAAALGRVGFGPTGPPLPGATGPDGTVAVKDVTRAKLWAFFEASATEEPPRGGVMPPEAIQACFSRGLSGRDPPRELFPACPNHALAPFLSGEERSPWMEGMCCVCSTCRRVALTLTAAGYYPNDGYTRPMISPADAADEIVAFIESHSGVRRQLDDILRRRTEIQARIRDLRSRQQARQ